MAKKGGKKRKGGESGAPPATPAVSSAPSASSTSSAAAGSTMPGADVSAQSFGAQSFGALATRASTRAQQAAQSWLNGHGLKLAYWPILLALSEGHPRSQVDLAAFVDRTPAAVSLIVAEMEREELVERRPNPANRRELLVTLTGPGLRKWEETADMWRHVNAIAYAGFSAKEIARLADLLTRASANLDAAAGLSPAARP